MKIKMILPALIDETNENWRKIGYYRFPPLGLATLAGYLDPDDDVTIEDEHVQELNLDDRPDLVVIQTYITNAFRAYAIADAYRKKSVHVVMGGLHVTALPDEAARHADTICLGPGEDIWPVFLKDFRAGHPQKKYQSCHRTLVGAPRIRRDLFKKDLYLTPNSIVVSRGCPHRCDFCYKNNFYQGGRSFYTMRVDAALEEIESLEGKHLFFLDDNLFGDPRFASDLFKGMRPMKKAWQAAGTVHAILNTDLVEKAAACGLRSLFVGFETLSASNLKAYNKHQNLNRDYVAAIHKLHSLGVMVNASFVFGMDNDDESVFKRTVDWAIKNSVETSSFHILTPYPGTTLYTQLEKQNRLLHKNWKLYDAKHAVFQPSKMSPERLDQGLIDAHDNFYKWRSIFKGALKQDSLPKAIRQIAYTGGWKKIDPVWDIVIQKKMLKYMLPLLELILNDFNPNFLFKRLRNMLPNDLPQRQEARPIGTHPASLS
ncbi:MAG: B12-binding domain-containing radical SAM protein [Candidatus Omnitrophica bacterium]|nr:B12-binding domain-containing radical SAM protein [Candidatus Omnitrophota bacterium]